MGIKQERQKSRSIVLSVAYRLNRLIPLSDSIKFRWFLNLEWVFNRFAHEYSFKTYDEDFHPMRLSTREFLLSKIERNHVVLDLGSNEGYISNYLADEAKYVVGVDFNHSAILKARQRYSKKNLEFINDDAFKYLRNSNQKFNVVILSHILEHLDDPLSLLQQTAYHFQYIYIEVPDFEASFLNQYRVDNNLTLNYTDSDHLFEFDRSELLQLVQKANLELLESEFKHGVQRFWCKSNAKTEP